MMSTVASLPSVVKPRFNRTSRKKAKLQKVMLASFVTFRTMAPDKLVDGVSSPSSNVKPAQHK
jgi:hypothetical protein